MVRPERTQIEKQVNKREEFGYDHPMGGLTIPCHEDVFIDVVSPLCSVYGCLTIFYFINTYRPSRRFRNEKKTRYQKDAWQSTNNCRYSPWEKKPHKDMHYKALQQSRLSKDEMRLD
ncbi:hypothetical protein LXL04_009837 [Taraxacum kok-saghyz]